MVYASYKLYFQSSKSSPWFTFWKVVAYHIFNLFRCTFCRSLNNQKRYKHCSPSSNKYIFYIYHSFWSCWLHNVFCPGEFCLALILPLDTVQDGMILIMLIDFENIATWGRDSLFENFSLPRKERGSRDLLYPKQHHTSY